MAIRARTWASIAIGIALAFAAARAYAGTGNPCIDDAQETFSDCKGDCKEGYQADKDACINKDHQCVEVCRAGRSNCVDANGPPGGAVPRPDQRVQRANAKRPTFPPVRRAMRQARVRRRPSAWTGSCFVERPCARGSGSRSRR